MARKKYDDDDGRTIADMSDMERAPLFVPRLKKERNGSEDRSSEEPKSDRPWEDNRMSKSERRAFIFGTLGATLLIASIFIVAFLILILVMLWAWGSTV